ncbi:MAG TPA: YkgJ family cysteine cluster protein [Gammaproteobacteria bacterium]|nr:YkgJ family cysteine cluster protein [Gammaproteobacteria bacterium]
MIHQKNSIRFNCTGCGQCCLGHPDEHFIELTDEEAEKIRIYLGMDKRAFKRSYLVRDKYIGAGLKINSHGRCELLDEDNRCTIYPVRPRQCITYPYWPELLESRAVWDAEAGRCEGINQGGVIATDYIEKQLALYKP